MISILVLYLTFGVFSNALIYPTNKITDSGGFVVRSNQLNDMFCPQCTPLFLNVTKGLVEKHKCKANTHPLVGRVEYTFSKCLKHCCYLKDLKDRLESEINQNNECPKTKIVTTIVVINYNPITLECESIGCKCFQKFVQTFESNHKKVSDKNCPNGKCNQTTNCCSKLEANEGFKDEMRNANECDSKVREEIVKNIDPVIYYATKNSCPDCKYKVEKSNQFEEHLLYIESVVINKKKDYQKTDHLCVQSFDGIIQLVWFPFLSLSFTKYLNSFLNYFAF